MLENDEIHNNDKLFNDEMSELDFRSAVLEIFRVLSAREDVSDDAALISSMLQLVVVATSRQTEVLEFIVGSTDAASILSLLPSRVN